MMAARDIHELSATISFAFGWPINVLLVWLILYRTTELMRIWSRILLQTALIDLAVLLVFFLIQPVVISDGQIVFCFLNGLFAHVPMALFLFLYYLCTFWREFVKLSLAVQFVYRWLVVCRDCQVSIFAYFGLLSIPAGCALFLILLMHYGWLLYGLKEAKCAECPEAVAILAMPQSAPFVQFVNTLIVFLNIATYSVIVWTSALIWLKSRRTLMQQQPQSREINRQIERVLLLQALLPLAVSLFPTLLFLVYSQDGMEYAGWVSILFSQSWPSVIYPLATILIVGQYRRTLWGIFKCKKARGESSGPKRNFTTKVQSTYTTR